MKLKFSVAGDGADKDVLVTADAAATVGDVAAELQSRLTQQPVQQQVTVKVHGLPTEAHVQPRLIDPNGPIGESSLPSGMRISIADTSELFDAHGNRRGDAAAILRIIEGPDAGQEFGIRSGSTHIGRDAESDIRLSDRFVSKRHIRISVGENVEVIDLGSANGTTVGGERIQRAIVSASDVVMIGDTGFTITPVGGRQVLTATSIAFNRSPLVQQIFAENEVDAPEPPGQTKGQRFPIIAMAGPVLIAAAMFGVVKATGMQVSPLMFVMLGMSPLLMVGAFFDQRRNARAEEKEALSQFIATVADFRKDLEGFEEQERSSRHLEAPSTADGLSAAEQRTRILWSRRPDRPGFLELRMGIGTVPSRTLIKMPDRRRANPKHWGLLADIQRDFVTIDEVPVVVSLREAGGVGVAGPTDLMNSVSRALIAQIACLHSPSEVAIAAVGSGLSASSWDWLKWLPHVGSAHSPISGESLADSASSAGKLVAELEELSSVRYSDEKRDKDNAPLPRVVLVVMDDAPVERSRLVSLAETGPAVGIHIVWCAESVGQIPAACRSFIELDAHGNGESGQVHLSEIVRPIRCESLDLDVAGHIARRLAPLVDSGAGVEDDSDLPRTVSFLTAAGTEMAASPDAVTERWVANDPTLVGGPAPKKGFALRSVVGQGAAGDPFALDLRVHGPHALVGGTTGAGKSEFLQAWVLGLAASQSPRRVTFLFVDYKGGSAFARCTELPHSVGIVTDLDQHLVRRALTSLRAELTYREEVLAHYRAKDIIDLEKRPDAPQLPSLIIVVDEFAALAQEVPEFVDGVVDVAQRGRSLGLHLILATQRPTGVIKGNLRANTNLRVALRMADQDDSMDVLGDAMSAGFDPAIPGRAAAKTGPGRITVFQSLYVGGSTPDVVPRPSVEAETFGFGAPELLAAPKVENRVEEEELDTDLNRTVDQIIAAAQNLNIPEPRKPWLPVLAPVYDFALLPQRTDTELVLGMQDLPHQQTNQLVYFRPDIDGNMAIIGTGGSGKSTILRTLAVAAAGTARGGPCDVYGLDFGSRGLAMIQSMPHVGAVISGSDHERVGRLLRWLRDETESRARRYAQVNAATISEFRAHAGNEDERRILVLLDGLPAFRQEYELGPRSAYYTLFGQLAADGRAVGVHFVVTADRPGAIPASLAATIQQRLILRLSDQNDYGMAGVPADILSGDSPPGRGILDGLEIQVAVIGGSASLPKQAEVTEELSEVLRSRGRTPARAIERLAEDISLTDLPAVRQAKAVIGVDDEDLKPFAVDPRGAFLVVGPPGSGRTTALATLVQATRRANPSVETYLFGSKRTTLRNLDSWAGVATTDTEVTDLASSLTYQFSSSPNVIRLLVIEGIDSLASTPAESELDALVKVALENDVFVVGEAEVSALNNAYMLGNTLKSARRGIALQPDDVDGQSVFKQAFPRSNRSEYPPGRGMVVESGRAARVQLAKPQ